MKNSKIKLYAICVVKNEADIIEYSLKKALDWANKVIVYDNGSDDGTWEIVQRMNSEKVVPFRQDNRPYSDGLRAHIFNEYKSELSENDWWVIQDGDEEYEDNPREFIQSQKGYFHHINGKKIDFCFDLNQIDSIPFKGDFTEDAYLFDHFTPEAWSEPRMIKHREGLKWEEKAIWPNPMGLVCSNTINIRHYPLRSKEQIMNRWETRKNSLEKGGQKFNHWEKEDWREYYSWKLEDLQKMTESIDVFQKVAFANNYKQPLIKRAAKFVLHKSGVLK